MTTYYQYIPVKPQYLDGDGDPYSGGKLYFYEAGTSTPLAVYKTAAGTAHASPIVLDSQGRIPDSDGIFLGSGDAYKVVLHDSSDVEIFSVDNLNDISASVASSGSSVPVGRTRPRHHEACRKPGKDSSRARRHCTWNVSGRCSYER